MTANLSLISGNEKIVHVSISSSTGDVMSLEKKQQSLFRAASCAFCFHLILTGGLLNTGNVFFGSVSVTGVVHCSSLSVTNLVYSSSPTVSILLTVSATWVSTMSKMSLVSMISRSCLCSRNGFPFSSSTVTSALTSFMNAACTPDCLSCLIASSVTSTILLFYGLFLKLCNHPGDFWPCYHPASPQSFTIALFCSRRLVKCHGRELLAGFVHEKISRQILSAILVQYGWANSSLKILIDIQLWMIF